MKLYRYFFIALLVILIDQTSKVLVHEYMYLYETVHVLPATESEFGFKLHYILNPGMAFGIRWESEFGKLALTAFRMVAMLGIAWYLVHMFRRKSHTGFLVCLGLILGGAIGNVIDSVFYGVIFNNAPINSPTPWFHGQVIDMLFFPLFKYTWPEWIPGLGGEELLFFSPVFNIADSSIFVGVTSILIFQKRFFKEEHAVPEAASTATIETAPEVASAEPAGPPASEDSTIPPAQ
jgi:signal peptidase II